jgi:hypothetical protein
MDLTSHSCVKYNGSGCLLRRIKGLGQAWSSNVGAGQEANNHLKIVDIACYEMLHWASDLVHSCEHGDEPWGSIKVRKFLDHLNDHQLLKKDPALW